MTPTENLTPTFAPELTALSWMTQVIDQLASARTPRTGLVGVDIGHVNLPDVDLVVSEPCAGQVGAEFGDVNAQARSRDSRRSAISGLCSNR
ncbi:hypothetical protein D6850_16495 [Roseovarius spongiae]|uniref:Uncharacterized protein n=1 Tax=Roseovarius spongiae TaxID=2320272 RepID=A0A3A8AT40_9RHOB|nr:hypothetical protein [Roseovarius spongiae]RKF12568.1 hypothetical protein D6850_16495 [Roseovarius spongiae]